MIEQFLHHIEKYSLCSREDRILLAVSGGLDSMVMLRLFQDCGFTIGVAHANFQLRGEASWGDEQFVHNYCQRFNIPFYFRRFETVQYAQENKLSVQMAARNLRYAWFEVVRAKENFTRISTAHHLNDSMETMLLNWINGSSMEGQLGVPIKNGSVIRPLLFATRQHLELFAQDHNLLWREDYSNADTDYQRNYIRHKIIPLLKELNPSLEQTVLRGMEKLEADYSFFQDAFRAWQAAHTEQQGSRMLIHKKGLMAIHHPGMAIWRCVNRYGFNYDTCVQAAGAIRQQPGAVFHSDTHDLVIDREVLIVSPKSAELPVVTITKGQRHARLGTFQLSIRKEPYHQQLFPSGDREIMIDADAVRFPLRWRTWKAGDAFYPLGLGHRKKVSDLLIDRKVSRADKQQITVLESDSKLVWVVGQQLDDRFKVTPATQTIFLISIRSEFD
ncbi:MAG: tRNA lysidine(34) synthetase TilS [Cyclobacteriaceae bacterium]|nr:tRNA lysidine(34) synthetase TilS [Cyclobacteriaceae bacterium]